MKQLLAIVLCITLALCIGGRYEQAEALSIDASALSSSSTRQLMASIDHLQKLPKTTVEVSGQYVKSKGAADQWSAGIASQFMLPYGVITDEDFRLFHDHLTHSAGVGFRVAAASVTMGVRVDYDRNDTRQTYGKLAATLKNRIGPFGVSASMEALRSDDEARFDYKAMAKYQIKRFYLAFKLEDVRKSRLQGVSLGVSI